MNHLCIKTFRKILPFEIAGMRSLSHGSYLTQHYLDHYDLARKRLGGLLEHLRHIADVLCQYDAVIKDQLNRGIIELVDKLKEPVHQVHYLPIILSLGVIRALLNLE